MITRKRARQLRKYIEQGSKDFSDEDALNSIELFPQWKTLTDYAAGDRVRDRGILYACVQTHISQDAWRPKDVPALWRVISIEEWPQWIQPTGVQDAYKKWDKVSYMERHWISIVDDNVWQPGIYGWEEA